MGAGAPVYLVAVLEYLEVEALELAGKAARDIQKTRLVPCHIQLAVRNNEEFSKMFDIVTLANGGVMPNSHNFLLPKMAAALLTEIRDNSKGVRAWLGMHNSTEAAVSAPAVAAKRVQDEIKWKVLGNKIVDLQNQQRTLSHFKSKEVTRQVFDEMPH